MRARAFVLWISTMCIVAVGGSPAFATTGGTTVASSTAHKQRRHRGTHSARSTQTAANTALTGATPAELPVTGKKTAVHGAPVTAKTIGPPYKGPVYEELDTGEVVPYQTPGTLSPMQITTGGSPVGMLADTKPELLVPGNTTRLVNGLAAAPMSAPVAVQQIVWAGNQIVGLPYIFGGGHASFSSPGYDCSGTVSFALHGASLLSTPMDSSEFMSWGGGGIGRWVTVFTNPGHAYMTVAGLRLDTSSADDPTNQQGPRWRPLRPGNGGFSVRHPAGL